MDSIRKKMLNEVFGRAVKMSFRNITLFGLKETRNECNFLGKVEKQIVIWKITRTSIVFQNFYSVSKKQM